MSSGSEGKDPNTLPFVAPCQSLEMDAPFHWLSLAWQDIKRTPKASLVHGFLLCLQSYAVTAVVTSINAVFRNKQAMLMWSVIIVVSVISGILTAWLSIILVMPLIGHATWYAYQDTIDASDWPPARPSPSGQGESIAH